MIVNAVPFLGFGFLDNFFMIIAVSHRHYKLQYLKKTFYQNVYLKHRVITSNIQWAFICAFQPWLQLVLAIRLVMC